jgi:predicted transcriptional regulator
MAQEEASSVALLPIRPTYASAIMRGEKRVEFRRRRFARNVDFVVVYACSPVQGILGYFRVSGVVEGQPQELWERYSEVGGIHEADYLDYYAGAKHAVAIEIEQVCVLTTPIPLGALGTSSKPPQSFKYMDRGAWDRLTSASSECPQSAA